MRVGDGAYQLGPCYGELPDPAWNVLWEHSPLHPSLVLKGLPRPHMRQGCLLGTYSLSCFPLPEPLLPSEPLMFQRKNKNIKQTQESTPGGTLTTREDMASDGPGFLQPGLLCYPCPFATCQDLGAGSPGLDFSSGADCGGCREVGRGGERRGEVGTAKGMLLFIA